MLIGYDPVAQVNHSTLYRNDAGTFVDSGAAFHNLFLGVVTWMDYDNDGDLDLLLAGNEPVTGDYLRILRNNATAPNTAPGAPGNLAALGDGTSVSFSWAAASDAQTPAPTLTYNLRVGTTPGGSEIVSSHSASTGYRRLPALGNAGHAIAARLRSLVPGITYYWSVQSVDAGFAGSSFANSGSFTATADRPTNVTFAHDAAGSRAVWSGTPGFTYRVETSEDLASWTSVATPTAASGTGLFAYSDVPPPDAAKRFYRAARP